MQECSICFSPILETIKCRNRSCTSVSCPECVQSYLGYSLADNIIPKCPNPTCGHYYLYSDLIDYPELIEIYVKCVFQELLGQHGDKARKLVEIDNNLANIRKVREDFLRERFPKGIYYTATIIMPTKLKRLNKQLAERIKAQAIQSNRICMNLTCNGCLNENFSCMSCGTVFCKECETVKGPSHTCKPGDLESIKAIKEMIHCPNCHLPIIRSDGCNNMTCAHCKQNFLYDTGNAGGSGAHVTPIADQTTKTLFSVVYLQTLAELNLIDLMNQIEHLEPSVTNENTLTKLLTQYYKTNQCTPKLEHDLGRAFESYIIHQYTNKRYHQAMHEIEKRIIDRTVTPEYLLSILQILNQPL